MNLRQGFKIVGLVLALAAGSSWLGCGLLGKPKITKPLPPTTAYDPKAATPRLRATDNLTVRLDTAGNREEHVKVVDEAGNIELPFVGKVHVADLTPAQAQDVIQQKYVPGYYKQLTVTIQLQTQRVIYVTGEVRTPGAIPYRDDLTVYRSIIQAGGFNEFADRRHVVLTHGDQQLAVDCLKVDLHPEQDAYVQPGDTIKVPRMAF